MLVSVAAALTNVLRYSRGQKRRPLAYARRQELTDRTGAVDITWVWKLKGFGDAAGAPPPGSSSMAEADDGRRRFGSGCVERASAESKGRESSWSGSVSSTTKTGGGGVDARGG